MFDVVAYQVVQEALTNVVKHAGAGATAEVRVSTAADMVTVEVTNTAGAGAQPLGHSGQGLLGMRERVGAYGGDLEFGPTAGRAATASARGSPSAPPLTAAHPRSSAIAGSGGCGGRGRTGLSTWRSRSAG